MARIVLAFLPVIALILCGANEVLGVAVTRPRQSTVVTTLEISNKAVSPDGFSRSAVVVNGQHPGPLIKANKGDTFHVKVVNSLNDTTMLRSTSVHWHGIFQHGTNWADGPVGVNQCPISPGHSFTYSFNVRGQAGTYWYHSHYGAQYCDGLRGPLVIYDPHDPYRYLYDVDDESTIITLGEWYHIPTPSIKTAAHADSILINGKGRYIGGPASDLSVVNVIPGKRYRFRLVSIACQQNFVFSIDSHQLTIIEADGQLTQPYTVDKLQIFAGQRYSFVLQANQPVANYWIRSLSDSRALAGFAGGINSAILRYSGAPVAEPESSDVAVVLLDEANLRPYYSSPAPGNLWAGGADYNFNFGIGYIPNLAPTFSIDGHLFQPPSVPVLLQILSGTRRPEDLLPQGSVYPLQRNKVVEITVPGGFIGGPHPFHMHGHAFSVVRTAGNTSSFNYENPILRDVVSPGPDGSSTTIRFTTDNAGPWLFHCHIEFHMDKGLALIFVEDIDDTAQRNPVPGSWDDLCPIFNNLPEEAITVDYVSLATTITANAITTPSSTIADALTGAETVTKATQSTSQASSSSSPLGSSSTPVATSTSTKVTPTSTSSSTVLTSPSSSAIPILGSLPTPSLSLTLPFQPRA